MGRPEKLSKEQQAEAIDAVRAGMSRVSVCAKFGISELTLRRYERNDLPKPAQSGQESGQPEAA